jgi:hypothetical protein
MIDFATLRSLFLTIVGILIAGRRIRFMEGRATGPSLDRLGI